MDRRRYAPAAADERARTAVERPIRRASSVEDAVLDLQHDAGNRGVAAVLGAGSDGVVQRKPAKGPKNDGGTLKLGGEDEIPLASATWSLKTAIAVTRVGTDTRPHVEPASQQAGDLTLRRRSDRRSQHLLELMGTQFPKGTLRLERPSRDGALPAANLELSDVSIMSFAYDKQDVGTESLGLAVDWMKVSGMGKEEPEGAKGKSAAPTPWEMRPTIGADELPAIPLISVEYSRPSEASARAAPAGDVRWSGMEPFHAKVTMFAGMALTRLAKAQSSAERFPVSFLMNGQEILRLDAALVDEITSTPDRADVVKVGLVAEIAKFVGRPTGKAGSAGKP